MQTHCRDCGLITAGQRDGLIDMHLLRAKQDSWNRARASARMFTFELATTSRAALMSEYAIRPIKPIQDLMESLPDNAPTYAQALVLATIDYIVAAQ